MRRRDFIRLRGWSGALLVSGVYGQSSPPQNAEARRPNLIFVLADDLGCGNLGCYGQDKIKTPHLDRMAAEGMRFVNHYEAHVPSRLFPLPGGKAKRT